MGANIHENVMDAMEKAEALEDVAQARKEKLDALSGEARERLDLLSGETRERYDILRQRYAELTGATLQASRRLVRAFPRMESRRHKELLDELKRRLEEVTRKK